MCKTDTEGYTVCHKCNHVKGRWETDSHHCKTDWDFLKQRKKEFQKLRKGGFKTTKKLNMGCGSRIKEGWDNVDIQSGPKIKYCFNFNEFPYPIPSDSYNHINLEDVLEHLDRPDKVMMELWRISTHGAIIDIKVPHYTNKGAYNHLQHSHFFNEQCFFQLEDQFSVIDKNNKFEIKELNIVPTRIGKYIPSWFRNKLSLFINGLHSSIEVSIKVNKPDNKELKWI